MESWSSNRENRVEKHKMILQAIKVNWGSCSKRSMVKWVCGAALAAFIK